MVRKIIRFPAPSLRRPCDPADGDRGLKRHIEDLRETLASTPTGVALASNQIQELGYRIFVVKPGAGLPEVFINPSWMPALEGAARVEMNEGCLSIPELHTVTMRYPIVTVTYSDIDGNPQALHNVEGLAAQIIQHECEHLDGGSLTDHISREQFVKLRMQAIKNRKAGR